MRWMIGLTLLPMGCIPSLTSPDSETDTTPQEWTAPENDWPMGVPPLGLVAGGFETGEVVPDFRLTDQKGQEVSMWQFHGEVVALDISTMWCSPCRELAEGAEETWEEFEADGFVYLTVLPENVERETPSLEDLNAWGDTFGISQPIISDPERLYSGDAVPGEAFPQVYIIGRDLVVRERLSVPTDGNLRASLNRVLDE